MKKEYHNRYRKGTIIILVVWVVLVIIGYLHDAGIILTRW